MVYVRNIYYLIYIILNLVFDNLASNCYRDFGNKNEVKQEYMFIIGILFGIVNGSSRLFWGYLMDKFGFKPLMLIISFLEISIAASFYFIVSINILYLISVLLVSLCIGGHFSLLAPLFNKVYGVSIGPQTYGMCGIFIGLANLTGPLLCAFFLKEKSDFLISFLISGSIVIIKIICLFLFDENEKYNFNENEENDIGKVQRESTNMEQ